MHRDIRHLVDELPPVENYFKGINGAVGLELPRELLLYHHDFSWPQSTASARIMLSIPLTDLTYEVEGKEIALKPGQAILVHPYLRRSVPDAHPNHSRLIIAFEAPLSQPYLPATSVMSMNPKAWWLLKDLVTYYCSQAGTQALLTLTLLLYELSGCSEGRPPLELSSPIEKVLALLDRHLQDNFTVHHLAEEVGLSTSHLRRRFLAEMGISLGEYMARHRLHAAMGFLQGTTLSIAEIATHCGYDTVFSFSRFFKTRTGISPSAYRKKPPTQVV